MYAALAHISHLFRTSRGSGESSYFALTSQFSYLCKYIAIHGTVPTDIPTLQDKSL